MTAAWDLSMDQVNIVNGAFGVDHFWIGLNVSGALIPGWQSTTTVPLDRDTEVSSTAEPFLG